MLVKKLNLEQQTRWKVSQHWYKHQLASFISQKFIALSIAIMVYFALGINWSAP